MRDIKFRGKAKDIERLNEFNEYNEFGILIPHQNGWVFGAYVHNGGNPYIISHDVAESCEEYFIPEWWCPVDPATVGQFTGLKERYHQMVGEGQEIHFGDVVRLFGGEYCQGYYEYDQTIVVKSAYDIVAMEESENIKLLGNVWDNPELL